MPEPRWRRLDADQRREEIFACAQGLFAQRPYAEVSTSDIAREAGVARGLLNHYFGTKRELYLEVVREAATVSRVAVASLPDGTLEERISAAVTWFLDALEAQGGSWINATGSHGLGRDPDLEAILVRAENDSVDRLVEAIGLGDETQRRGEVRAVIRSFGQMARASGREWLIRKSLSRDQVQVLLEQSLLAIVREVLPRTVEPRQPERKR